MSDSNQELRVINTITEGITLGLKNMVPIGVNALLWLLTCWIPYLNVGTTIGLYVGIITKLNSGESIPMTEIFDPKYRKFMGEYFLTAGLMSMGAAVGFVLAVIPGFIILLAWSFAPLLVIDKGKNPTEALVISNKCTYGNKVNMFGIYFLFYAVIGIVGGLLIMLFGKIHGFLAFLVFLAVAVVAIFGYEGIQARIYKQLAGDE